MTFIDNIRRAYRQSSMLMRIIAINIGVFLLLFIVARVAMMFGMDASGMLRWVAVPNGLGELLRRPWTVVTFMFTHFDLLPVLFNMLWLYWMGRIFMEFFSPKQLMGVYLLGGWVGMLLFLLVYNLIPGLAGASVNLSGASASILAIVVAIAVYTPDYKIGILFLGEISLKWIAVAVVAFIILGFDVSSPGGSIAHVGGILVGAWYAWRIRRGRDITRPLNAVLDAIVGLFNVSSWKLPKFTRRKKGASVAADTPQSPRRAETPADEVSEEELDIILGKIKVAGYDALTDEEKDKLFKASRRRTV